MPKHRLAGRDGGALQPGHALAALGFASGACSYRRGKLARGRGGSHSKLLAQTLRELVIDGQRGGRLTGSGETSDQLALGLLGQRIQRDMTARQQQRGRQIATRLGLIGGRAKRLAQQLS